MQTPTKPAKEEKLEIAYRRKSFDSATERETVGRKEKVANTHQ